MSFNSTRLDSRASPSMRPLGKFRKHSLALLRHLKSAGFKDMTFQKIARKFEPIKNVFNRSDRLPQKKTRKLQQFVVVEFAGLQRSSSPGFW